MLQLHIGALMLAGVRGHLDLAVPRQAGSQPLDLDQSTTLECDESRLDKPPETLLKKGPLRGGER